MPELGNNKKPEEMSIWIDKEGIVHVRMIRDLTSENIKNLIEEGRELVKRLSGKPKVIIDIASGLSSIPFQLRKEIGGYVKELVENPGFKKVAISGGIIARTIASFIIAASGEKNIKVFETKEEALKWLKK